MIINVFLPCRKGSERVPKKNLRPFAGFHFGLIEIKLKQLIGAKHINHIYLSSNDDEILEYAASLNEAKIVLHKRKQKLALNQTSTDQLVRHAAELIQQGDILWTHVTSPFVTTADYDQIIETYFEQKQNGYDSLMTTNLIRSFLWNRSAPLNYDRTKEKWPRTQTLDPIYEINSAIFLANHQTYKFLNDRIGSNPYLYPLNKIQGIDIDWEDDFQLAQAILNAGIVEI